MTNPWYWALFAAATLLFIGVPLLSYWEARRDRQDAELWAELYGGDIHSRKVD